MLVSEQLRIRMDELKISPPELGRRIGVSSQTVRGWLNNRSFPEKKKTGDIERELSFRIDFSEGTSAHTNTVSDSIQTSAVNALIAINKLPPDVQLLFHKLAEAYAHAMPGASEDTIKGHQRPLTDQESKSSPRPISDVIKAHTSATGSNTPMNKPPLRGSIKAVINRTKSTKA